VQLVSDRPRSLPAKTQVLLRAGDLLRLRVVLDAIETEDQIDCLLRDRRRRDERVDDAAAHGRGAGAAGVEFVGADLVSARPAEGRRWFRRHDPFGDSGFDTARASSLK
jgi:hypothetical protein